jgi:antitoxin (DNA-binding transcriptional repressor) of toxin-antitoxin stability system
MYQSTISNSKAAFSSLIDQVKAGETVMITDRDVPVALLTPIPRQHFHGAELLAGLERQGIIRRAEKAEGCKLTDLPPETPLTGALSALLEERREGR